MVRLRLRKLPLVLCLLASVAFAGGPNSTLNRKLLSAQSMSVLEIDSRKPAQRSLAELKSFLMDQPLTIGVENGLPTRAQERAILKAIDLWQDALGDSPFVLAQEGEKPDVTVRFVDRIEGEPMLQGQIEMDRRFSWSKRTHSYRVSALMKVRDVFRGREISQEELASVVAHELGHLFGLEDVSDTHCLMGPFISGRSSASLARAELEAVKAYRQALKDRIRQLQSK